jgi:hypothetical protein
MCGLYTRKYGNSNYLWSVLKPESAQQPKLLITAGVEKSRRKTFLTYVRGLGMEGQQKVQGWKKLPLMIGGKLLYESKGM